MPFDPAGAAGNRVSLQWDRLTVGTAGQEITLALGLSQHSWAEGSASGDDYGDPALETAHTLPQTLTTTGDSTPREDDLLRIYGIYRNTNALASCAMFGTSCGVDTTFMGTWSDGTPVTPAVVTDDPVDSGAGATITCGSLSNPRRDYCP